MMRAERDVISNMVVYGVLLICNTILYAAAMMPLSNVRPIFPIIGTLLCICGFLYNAYRWSKMPGPDEARIRLLPLKRGEDGPQEQELRS